jgi:hypothetical protein
MWWFFDCMTTCLQCGVRHPEVIPSHDGVSLVDVCPVCIERTPHSYYPECHGPLPSGNQDGARERETV